MILLKSSRTSVCVCVFVALCCNEHWYTGMLHRGMCKNYQLSTKRYHMLLHALRVRTTRELACKDECYSLIPLE